MRRYGDGAGYRNSQIEWGKGGLRDIWRRDMDMEIEI